MGGDNPLLIIPFILVTLVALFLAGEAWQKRNSPGSLNFALLMLAVCIWLIASGGNLASSQPEQKLFWAKVAYLGICWLSTLWLAFCLDFSYQHSRFLDRIGWVLWVMPLLTILIVFTNELHHWYWSAVTYTADGNIDYVRGFWFWIFVPYSYMLLAVGCGVLIRGLFHFPNYLRRQIAALILGMLLPWLANITYLAGWLPQRGLDLTPFTFSITGILYTWTLFRMRLFDPVPQARDTILEQMGEGYLAIDTDGRILDCNRLAKRMLNLGSAPVAGRHFSEVLVEWPVLVHQLQTRDPNPVEIHAGTYVLEASLTTWFGRKKTVAGNILILYDISRRHHAENQLRESEQLYRLLVNSSPVGIVIMDSAGRLTFASPEVRDLFGVAVDDPMLEVKITDWVHPEERQLALKLIDQASERREKVQPITYRLLRSDGSTFWGEVASTQMRGEEGETGAVVSVIRDVTAQKELELRLQRNLEQQTFSNNLLQLVYQSQNLREALDKALELTGLFIHTSRVYLCQDSRDGSESTIISEWCAAGILPRAREGPLLRYGRLPSLEERLVNRGIVIIPFNESTADFHAQDEVIPPDLLEFTDTWNVLSFAAFPIYTGEKRRHGFLGFDDCANKRKWSGDEIDLLWNVCKIISGAVLRVEIEEAERNQRLMTEALQDTARALTSTLNPEEVLDRVLANIDQVVQSDAVSISMVSEESLVSFVRWRGYDREGAELMVSQHMHISERETYRVMSQTGEPVIVSDTWLDKSWKRQDQYSWIRSYAGAPILVKGKVVGFLNVDSSLPDFFTGEDSERLRVFADQAAVAIEN
ncbi:MAG: PAS domain S-box protein, partial [Anaerolineaceae bacterium]|nr:PAS domain S-box protein [Anaerolineaceae bacterium]